MGMSLKDAWKIPSLRKALVAQGYDGRECRAKARPVAAPMNGTERDYGRYLDTRQAAGEVIWWAFNSIRLRIAQGNMLAWFKPDFVVMLASGAYEVHETKGYEREAALVRLKVAAGFFPFRFVLVKRDGESWSFEEFGSGLKISYPFSPVDIRRSKAQGPGTER